VTRARRGAATAATAAARRAAAAWRQRAAATTTAKAATTAAAAGGDRYDRGATRASARGVTAAAGKRRGAGRDAWRRWAGTGVPVHCRVLAPRPPLPYRSATRRTLARATRSRTPLSIFVSTCSCAPRVFRRASQGPQGRVVPFGGARRGPDRRLRTAVQQRRPGRVPRFIGAYSSSPHTVCLCVWV